MPYTVSHEQLMAIAYMRQSFNIFTENIEIVHKWEMNNEYEKVLKAEACLGRYEYYLQRVSAEWTPEEIREATSISCNLRELVYTSIYNRSSPPVPDEEEV